MAIAKDKHLDVAPTEVSPKASRRRFTAEYKRRILREADACRGSGEVGALLRREGLYSSHLTSWRQARERGELEALTPKKRGRRARKIDAPDARVAELERENANLRAKQTAKAEDQTVDRPETRRATSRSTEDEKLVPEEGILSGEAFGSTRAQHPNGRCRKHPDKPEDHRHPCGCSSGREAFTTVCRPLSKPWLSLHNWNSPLTPCGGRAVPVV